MMMTMTTYVADTHALVWHLAEPRRRGKAARKAFDAIDRGKARCHVPAIVLVEIALRHEKGRMKLGAAQVLDLIGGHPGYAILPLDLEQAMLFGRRPALRDPMDRIILAAALATGSRLLSADPAFDGHVERTWD